MKPKIVVVGSINMDLVVRSKRVPAAGETILGEAFHTIPGGKGANQAAAAARLGAHVSMIGCVGEDAFGRQMIEQLQQEGVDTSFIRAAEGTPTGVAVIHVEQDGNNRIIVVPGANAELTAEDVHQAEGVIAQADVMLVQLEIPLETVAEAVALGSRHGLKVIVNPAPAPASAHDLPASIWTHTDYLTPNETELAILASEPRQQHHDLTEPLCRLNDRLNNGSVIVTLGEKGVCYIDEAGAVQSFPAYEVDVVDTTAAGDSFNAGLAVALGEGRSLQDSISFASKAGALAVTRLGAQTSLPTREEADTFLGK